MAKPNDVPQSPPPPKTIAERRAEREQEAGAGKDREDTTRQLAESLARDIQNEYSSGATVSHTNNRLNISRSSDGAWLQVVVEDANRYGVTTGKKNAPQLSQEVFDRNQLLDRLDQFVSEA